MVGGGCCGVGRGEDAMKVKRGVGEAGAIGAAGSAGKEGQGGVGGGGHGWHSMQGSHP